MCQHRDPSRPLRPILPDLTAYVPIRPSNHPNRSPMPWIFGRRVRKVNDPQPKTRFIKRAMREWPLNLFVTLPTLSGPRARKPASKDQQILPVEVCAPTIAMRRALWLVAAGRIHRSRARPWRPLDRRRVNRRGMDHVCNLVLLRPAKVIKLPILSISSGKVPPLRLAIASLELWPLSGLPWILTSFNCWIQPRSIETLAPLRAPSLLRRKPIPSALR
jgi:hypothetical protein